MRTLVGGIFMGLGILIGGASGLCTLLFMLTMGPFALLVGGIPIAIGVGLFYLGKVILRKADLDLSTGADSPTED